MSKEILGKLNKSNSVMTSISSGSGIEVDSSDSISIRLSASDKILSTSNSELSSTLSIELGNDNRLYLKGISDSVIGSVDLSKYTKDAVLDSAELVVNPEGQAPGTYIKLVFNTESGKSPIFINVSSLVDIYTAGNGLNLNNSEFSIKLDGSTLSVSSSGLKVSEISQSQVTNLSTDLGNKVDKEIGKGLSTNDFTKEDKSKLDGIASNAQVNVIEEIKVNDTKVDPVSKSVNISVPTGALASKDKVAYSDLDNNLSIVLDNKVNKIEGKGLSTNDFTDEYRDQVDISKLILDNNWTDPIVDNDNYGAMLNFTFKPSVFTTAPKVYIKSFELKSSASMQNSGVTYCKLQTVSGDLLAMSDGNTSLNTMNKYGKFTFDRLVELDSNTEYRVTYCSDASGATARTVAIRLYNSGKDGGPNDDQDIYCSTGSVVYKKLRPITKFEFYTKFTEYGNTTTITVEEDGHNVEYVIPYISRTVVS